MQIFFVWFLCSILGAAILSRYKKAGTGFLLGAILGPVGVLFTLVMRSGESNKEDQKGHQEQMNATSDLMTSNEVAKPKRACPYCLERIPAKARVCKHCGEDVEQIEA